jgi:hypothetical protein
VLFVSLFLGGGRELLLLPFLVLGLGQRRRRCHELGCSL